MLRPQLLLVRRAGSLCSVVLALAAVLSGCSHLRDDALPPASPPAAAPPAPVAPAIKPVEPASPQARLAARSGEQTLAMLAYAERIRQIPPAELNAEIARLSDIKMPVEQLQLSFALSQLRQLPELIRAQELLARVLGNAEAEALHPLARLLASRYSELRRLGEQLDKQAQQIRDSQRRLEQANERLEALKAIERSLVSRPPAPAVPAVPPAPPNRPKTAP